MHTCSLQCAGALYFNYAHPAAADLVDVLEVAESKMCIRDRPLTVPPVFAKG